MISKDNPNIKSSDKANSVLSVLSPYASVITWFFIFTLAMETFRFWDWDHGIVRFLLLLLIGSLAFIVKFSLRFIQLDFYSNKFWTFFALLLLLLGLTLNISTAKRSLYSSYHNNQIGSDQAQTVLRAITLFRHGINPYSKTTFLDPVAYDFAIHDLTKAPQCGETPPHDIELLLNKIIEGTASIEEMKKYQLVQTNDSTCSNIKRRFESMGFKYGPVLMLSYFPFILVFGVSGILISHIFFLGLLLALILRWTWNISRSWFLAICSNLLILYSFHLRWNILELGHTDILPTLLAMFFLFSWSNKRYIWAVISLGLSIGTKTTPGILFLPLLLGQPQLLLVTGGIVLLIYFPFIVWDAGGLWNNLAYPFLRPADSTALAYYLPPNISICLTAIVGLGCFWFMQKVYRDGCRFSPSLNFLIYAHLGLLGTSGQFHNNYLMWLLPLLSIYLIQTIIEGRCEGIADCSQVQIYLRNWSQD